MEVVPDKLKCYVCLEVFIYPVRFPCNHKICRPCAMKTYEHNGEYCIICRKRVSTYIRKNGYKVDEVLWEEIKTTYPDSVKRRLSNSSDSSYNYDNGNVLKCNNTIKQKQIDDALEYHKIFGNEANSSLDEDFHGFDSSEVTVCHIIIGLISSEIPITVLPDPEYEKPIIVFAKPGEINQEYIEMNRKEEELERERREKYSKMDEETAKKIQEEELQELERIRKEKEEQERRDIEIAQKEMEEEQKEYERLIREKEEQERRDEEFARSLLMEDPSTSTCTTQDRETTKEDEDLNDRETTKEDEDLNISPITINSSRSTVTIHDKLNGQFKNTAHIDNCIVKDDARYLGPHASPVRWQDIPSTSKQDTTPRFVSTRSAKLSNQECCSTSFGYPTTSTPVPKLPSCDNSSSLSSSSKSFEIMLDSSSASKLEVDNSTAEVPGPSTSKSVAKSSKPAEISKNKELSNFTAVVPGSSTSSFGVVTEVKSRCSSGADSIDQELNTFKPIRASPTTPPKDGSSEPWPQLVVPAQRREGAAPGACALSNTSEHRTIPTAHFSWEVDGQEHTLDTDREYAQRIQEEINKELEMERRKESNKRVVCQPYNLRKKAKKSNNLRKNILVGRAQATLDNLIIK